MWSQTTNLKVIEVRANMFQFNFRNEKDRKNVLSRRPWIYDGQPLVLKKWKAGLEEEENAFNKTLIWVQIWNTPLHWVTKEVGRKIGSIFTE